MKSVFLSIFLSTYFIFEINAQYTILPNVSYGADPQQIMDIYVPQASTANMSRVIVLIHGGAWSAGKKEDMNGFLPYIATDFPNYSVANLEYRLGTASSPGYPKQVEDINAALGLLKSALQQNYNVTNAKFALMGGSAGAHLSMLYGYRYSTNNSIGAVVNIVGPSDFTDPAYAWNPIYNTILFGFVGQKPYIFNQALWKETSPVTYITSTSPPTISFYGNADILVPNSQLPRLRNALNKASVINQDTVYNGGHFDWDAASMQDMKQKTTVFLNQYF